jgi:SPP1 family predicted phage head-tail adaptor
MQPSKVQDATGGLVTADATLVAEVWASIEHLSGRALYAAQQVVSECTHLITIRWIPGIEAKMLVWFYDIASPVVAPRQFRIEDVASPDEVHHYLELLVIERDDSSYEVPGR